MRNILEKMRLRIIMIPIKNGAMCKCVKEYIFNHTKTFNGVTYQVDLGTTDSSDLVAVIQPNPYAYVGMSKSRFAEHFIFLERRD